MRTLTSCVPRLALAVAMAPMGTAAAKAPWVLSDEGRRALETVSADALRGHLSFLAADALGGRVNGSPGLDVAAEYVASRMRAAGLEPLGDDGYFQTAPAVVAVPSAAAFRFSVSTPEGSVDIPPEEFQMTTVEAVSVVDTEIVKVLPGQPADLDAIAGRAVLTEIGETPPRPNRREAHVAGQRWTRELLAARAALVVAVTRGRAAPTGYFDTPSLIEPPSTTPPPGRVVTTSSAELARLYAALPATGAVGRLTLNVAEPRRQRTSLRNVAGLLRGSDPALSGTYLLVSAHYDGTGPQPGSTGPDRIWNGANDDASGTAAVVELATAFARLRARPRRSIVFLAFFGEERGLIGSAYYAAHPLVPLEKTVAGVNLEHLGRTDSVERSSKAGTASLTGYDYSDVPAIFEAAGQATGVDVYRDARRSDAFFSGSDNYSLANAGVVAHTVCVVFEDFADYHGAGDEWPKIDFANMERTARMVGAAVLMIADATAEPRWRPDVEEAAPYRAAWERLHGSGS
jgi:peptidase M28-like protein